MKKRVSQTNKVTGLPVGISATWRIRPSRSPYKNEKGIPKTKHFYVGVQPISLIKYCEQLSLAIHFRDGLP
jgi:hypothetical protein